MQRAVERALASLTWAEAALAISAYALVAGLLLADVIGREVFNESIYGAQKIAVQATLIAAFMGMTLATSSGSHLRAEGLDRIVPERWGAQADRFGQVLSLFLFALLAAISVQYVLETRSYNILIPVLGWPLWPVQLVLPIAFASSALKHLAFALYPVLAPRREIAALEE